MTETRAWLQLWAVATLAGAPVPLIVAGELSVAAVLGCTWSRRRLLCGPTARGLR
jgi:hypothetical protein